MSKWPTAKLGELLQRRECDVAVNAAEFYQFAGVYCFGRGVFRGRERLGSQFAYQRLTRLRSEDFVYPKLMAWEGAFGVVPQSCDGCVVSPEFPVFELNRELINPSFLKFYFQIPRVWEEVSGGSTGTNVRRRRLNPGDFQRASIPLPSLVEQQRVVARIEQLGVEIHEARALRAQAAEDAEKLMAGAERKIWPDETLHGASYLESLTTFLSRGKQSEQGESEHFLIKTQHVQQDRYIPTLLRLAAHIASKVKPDAMVQDGDILIACSAAGCLGRVARYRSDGRTASTDTHVAILRPDSRAICPDYLYAYLRGAQGQHQIRSRERGDWQREKIGFRLTELNLNDLRKVPVPVPSVREQHRIVAELDALQKEVGALRGIQAETDAELDALLPAILDRAFKGEL